MKRALSILFLLFALRIQASAQVLSNNYVVVNVEASYATVPYFYHDIWISAGLYLALPKLSGHWRNAAKSGGTLQDHNQTEIPKLAVAHWGNHTNAQYWGIIEEGGNGGYTPFQIATNLTNTIAAPVTTFSYAGFYTNEPGWCATSHVYWIGQGDIPGDQSDGQTTYRDGNNALTNFFGARALPYVDEWNPLFNIGGNGWSNDINSGSPILTWNASSHPSCAGQLDMACNRWLQLARQIGLPTNIYSLSIDFNNGAVTSTNGCTATSFSKSGNSVAFTFVANGLGMPFDVPDGVCTNDARDGLRVMPQFTNTCNETWQVTNLPAGNYLVTEDSSNTTVLTSAQLAAGWNRWTLTKGWEWAQKRKVVNDFYDLNGADHTTLLTHSAGVFGVNGWPDLVNYLSFSGGYFTTNSGQAIITDLHSIETNLDNFDAVSLADAQPVAHTIIITQILPRYAPARLR